MRVSFKGSVARTIGVMAFGVMAFALLGGCASIPEVPGTPIAPVAKKEPHVTFQGGTTPPPAFEPSKPPVAAPDPKPLDATRLPPFDGEKHVVKEPLRGVATVDRTVQPDDLWERIRAGFSMPNLEGPIVQDRTAWYAARQQAPQAWQSRAASQRSQPGHGGAIVILGPAWRQRSAPRAWCRHAPVVHRARAPGAG